jgi:hypothetical protein
MAVDAQWNPLKLDWRVEQAKADRLEELYQRSGRAEEGHAYHGLFTGLAAESPSAQALGTSTPGPTAASPGQGEQASVCANPNATTQACATEP